MAACSPPLAMSFCSLRIGACRRPEIGRRVTCRRYLESATVSETPDKTSGRRPDPGAPAGRGGEEEERAFEGVSGLRLCRGNGRALRATAGSPPFRVPQTRNDPMEVVRLHRVVSTSVMQLAEVSSLRVPAAVAAVEVFV